MRHACWIVVILGAACGSDDDPNCVSRVGGVEPQYDHEDGLGTHAGESCIESGCHLNGDLGLTAPAYHAAGTIFKRDLVTPQPGVTVRFTPLGGGAAQTAVTDAAGNFFILASGPMPFPSIPEVTACPDVEEMIEGALDPSYGSCATASCHSFDSGRGPIFLGD